MRFLMATVLLVSLFFYFPKTLGEITVSDAFCKEIQNQDPTVKVLLMEEVSTVLIESKGAYGLLGDGLHIGSYQQGKRATLHALYGNFRWGEQLIDAKCLTLIPEGEDSTIFVNGIQYKGSLHVYRSDNNISLSVVNEVSTEEFLCSTLSVKYLQNLPKEALSALIILERTAFYERLLLKGLSEANWHVLAEEENYFGYGVTKRFFGVEEAVDWTMRLILDNTTTLANVEIQEEMKEKIIRLASQGLNARQILEVFYPQANFVIIEQWDGSLY